MTNIATNIDKRILRDMNDGILVLDITGTILYVNRQALGLLGLQSDPTGKKYATEFMDSDPQNDDFHQMILDAVYNKNSSLTEVVAWHKEKQKQMFRVTSSFLQSEECDEKNGVVILFSDVTQTETLNQQRQESSVIYASVSLCMSGYVFFWSIAKWLEWDIPSWVFNLIVLFFGLIMFVFIMKHTSFSIQDIGLRVINAKATLLPDILIAVVGVALLVGGKLIILQIAPGFFPAGAPFWDWSVLRVSDLYYPITVFFQEFLALGVIFTGLKRIFTGKHSRVLTLLVVAMMFGVMHIAVGFPYMVGSAVLFILVGILYSKQRHIWGICIIHYILGEAAVFLRYIV